MKFTKKLFTLLVTIGMTLSMGVSAFADDPTYTLTLTGVLNKNDTFKAYQVFTGDLDGSTLSNIAWGEGVDGTGLLTELAKIETTEKDGNGQDVTVYPFKDLETASDVAEALGKYQNDSDVAKEFAAAVSKNLKGAGLSGTYDAEKKEYTFSNLSAGYYFVKSDNTDAESASTKFMLKVVKDETAAIKAEAPTMEKKVKETNDSTGVTTDWQDASDYDIGDYVPYQIKTTIISKYGDYDHYYLAFNDTMDAGLSFADYLAANGTTEAGSYKLKVLADGTTDITSAFKLTTSEEHKFVLECMDLKTVESVTAGTVITVEYYAQLNKDAKHGSEGNKNTANMEFSNNPNHEGDGTTKPDTGKTPDDTVITFTYKTVVNKVDEEENPLAGAAFTLYKKVNGAWETVKEYTVDKDNPATSFSFNGLDAGSYKLSETTTPAGYNTIKDIEFEIKSTFGTEDEADNLDLKSLTVVDSNNNVISSFTIETDQATEGSSSFTGKISTDVENKSGAQLPSTGGMGTTIIYIAGAMLVICAGVLLFGKKRISE